MDLKNSLCIVFCLAFFSALLVGDARAQQQQPQQQTRSRIVTTGSSQPTNVQSTTGKINRKILSSPTTNPNQRPVLTNQIAVAPKPQPMVQKIVSSQPVANALTLADSTSPTLAARYLYSSNLNTSLMRGIESKFGIPYRLGSTGPNRYDCSGFVWSVFNEAGILFERSTARTYWEQFEPVTGTDRFKFGTLVFFNKLGHVGIVADENGFYHASSSKGITYSPFKGYWEKRIVGFRRIPKM